MTDASIAIAYPLDGKQSTDSDFNPHPATLIALAKSLQGGVHVRWLHGRQFVNHGPACERPDRVVIHSSRRDFLEAENCGVQGRPTETRGNEDWDAWRNGPL